MTIELFFLGKRKKIIVQRIKKDSGGVVVETSGIKIVVVQMLLNIQKTPLCPNKIVRGDLRR